MRRALARRALAALAVLWTASPAVVFADPVDRPLTISQYIDRLDALASAVSDPADGSHRLATLVDELPAAWRVEGAPGVFEIPTGRLRGDLRAWLSRNDTTARKRALDRIRALRSDGVLFRQLPSDRTAERALLMHILAGPEYQNIHGPTSLDRLWQRVLEILAGWFVRAIRPSAVPTIGNVIVYGVMGIAAALGVWWTYRFLRRSGPRPMVIGSAPAISTRDWQVWLADARAARAAGNWRAAVHFAYWCGVSFLEARGAWRPDRSRTPREYLRLLSPSTDDGVTLALLTRQCERVWYGGERADARTVEESIEQLRKLGCPA